jgi:hypothetical protein
VLPTWSLGTKINPVSIVAAGELLKGSHLKEMMMDFTRSHTPLLYLSQVNAAMIVKKTCLL